VLFKRVGQIPLFRATSETAERVKANMAASVIPVQGEAYRYNPASRQGQQAHARLSRRY
jgi:hypothetical protein